MSETLLADAFESRSLRAAGAVALGTLDESPVDVEPIRRGSRKRTAVARFEGRIQPLPAVVHVRAAAAACREAEASGADRLDAFVSAVDPHTVPERVVRAHVDPAAFHNINTHDDLAQARDSTASRHH